MKNDLFYTVLLGDIIQSRKDFNSAEWKSFPRIITEVNKMHKEDFLIPLAIFSGDSFGAVLKSPLQAIKTLFTLEKYSHQLARYVIIEDEIHFGIEERRFELLEGPALWKGADKLSRLKNTTKVFLLDTKDMPTRSVLENSININFLLKRDWSENQLKMYELFLQDKTQKEIARLLSVSQQYVSKIQNKLHFSVIADLEYSIQNFY